MRVLLVFASLVALSAAQLAAISIAVDPCLECGKNITTRVPECAKCPCKDSLQLDPICKRCYDIMAQSPICARCPCIYPSCDYCKERVSKEMQACLTCPCPDRRTCDVCNQYFQKLPANCAACICPPDIKPIIDNTCLKCNSTLLFKNPACRLCPCRDSALTGFCKECYAQMDSILPECPRCPCINPPPTAATCSKCLQNVANMPYCQDTCPCLTQPDGVLCKQCIAAMGSEECARCPCYPVSPSCETCTARAAQSMPSCLTECPCVTDPKSDSCIKCQVVMGSPDCARCPCPPTSTSCDNCKALANILMPTCLTDCPCVTEPGSDYCMKCLDVMGKDCENCPCDPKSTSCDSCAANAKAVMPSCLTDCPCVTQPGSEYCKFCMSIMGSEDCQRCPCKPTTPPICEECLYKVYSADKECASCPCNRDPGSDLCARCTSLTIEISPECPQCVCKNCTTCFERIIEEIPDCRGCPCREQVQDDTCRKCYEILDSRDDCKGCNCFNSTYIDCGFCKERIEQTIVTREGEGIPASICRQCPCLRDPNSKECAMCTKWMYPYTDCYFRCYCPA